MAPWRSHSEKEEEEEEEKHLTHLGNGHESGPAPCMAQRSQSTWEKRPVPAGTQEPPLVITVALMTFPRRHTVSASPGAPGGARG